METNNLTGLSTQGSPVQAKGDTTEMAFENFNRMVVCMDWCKNHNAKLIKICENGFYYTNANGDWYMAYEEM